jgi:hypothetical protein
MNELVELVKTAPWYRRRVGGRVGVRLRRRSLQSHGAGG